VPRPLKLDILKMTLKKTFIGHIDFIPVIESSKFVEALCKIEKSLEILFLRYRPLSESCFGKLH
jgi:hypothetical protein